MSRNLCQTTCEWCGSDAVRKVGPDHSITRDEAGRYYDEYESMIVADAECAVCSAKYLAWVDERGRKPYASGASPYVFTQRANPDDGDRAFFDLSYRTAFNDEPAECDQGHPSMVGGAGVAAELAALQARLAESEAQRAELVAALEEVRAWREPMDPTIEKELALLHKEMEACPECKAMANHPVSRGVCAGGKYRHYERTRALYEKRDRISDNTTPYQVCRIADKALANQPPSDLVALVKAVGAFRQHEAKCQENQDAGNLKDHVVKRLELLGEMYAALDTLLTNQPGFRALIESEDVCG